MAIALPGGRRSHGLSTRVSATDPFAHSFRLSSTKIRKRAEIRANHGKEICTGDEKSLSEPLEVSDVTLNS